MFRYRKNIVKQVGRKLTPDSKQLKTVLQDFFSDSKIEPKRQQKQNPSNLADTFKANKPNNKRNESYYRDKLAKSLNGQTEVKVPYGRIDILTSSQIIEVKHIKKWHAALGQIITYAHFYPNHQKRIHLFGVENNSNKISMIEEQCRAQNIIVTFE